MAPRRRAGRSTRISVSDVTVHDCADATKMRRPRKSNIINILVYKEIHVPEVMDKSSDYGSDIESMFPDLALHTKCANKPEAFGNIEYPEILFHLLSGYILPEEIGRFARINRAAAAATRRAGFWRRLYARHCRPDEYALPTRLRLHDNAAAYAIRQRVVRALHLIYLPFLNAERDRRRRGATTAALSPLVGLRCVDVWYEKDASSMRWKYYVKLKPKVHTNHTSDVMANPEEESVVLIAVNKERVAIPAAMGLLVSGAGASLGGAALDTRRVHLDLTRALHLASPALPDCSLVLHTVQELETVRWWQPRFPVFTASPPKIHFDPDRPLLDTDFQTMA